MTEPLQLGDRDLIDAACEALGITVDELGEKIRFKSIRRYRNGEFQLTDAKRQHIQDLVAISKVREVPTRHAPTNMPPHRELPQPLTTREEPASYGTQDEVAFAACVRWLTELHDRHPQAFRSAAAMIKGLYESLKK